MTVLNSNSKFPRLRAMMNEYGPDLEQYLQDKGIRARFLGGSLKGDTEFQTVWNAARRECVDIALSQLIQELNNL